MESCRRWKVTNDRRWKAKSSSCRRFRRSVTGLPVWGRRSAESRASLCPMPAGCPAGVSFPPVVRNGIAGAGKPFLVTTELFQRFRGKELRAIAGGMAERFQQTCRNKHWNFLRFKAEKPRRLSCVEPCWNNFPTEKFCLLRGHIHTLTAARRLGRGEWFLVCFSEFFCSFVSGASASTWLGAWFLVRSSFSSISLWRRVNCW